MLDVATTLNTSAENGASGVSGRSTGAPVSGIAKQRDFSVTQEVLRAYGMAVKEAMRQTLWAIAAARYGGEEFFVVLPDTPLQDAVVVAERIRQSVASLTFPGRLEELRVTVSLGVASYPAKGVTSVETLIRAADRALYRAKQGGRNRTESEGG